MEEEDRSDADHEDNVASQTVVENLNLLTEKLQTIFRDELGLVRDVVEQSVGAVKHLASAVRETQLEMRGLKALMDTMSEKIDKLTEENRALRAQTPVPATQPLPPPPSTPPPQPKRKRTGPQTPHQPAKQQRNTSPTPTLMHSVHAGVETNPAQPAPSTSATATGPAPRHGETDEGWKKVERKRKGKGKEKKGKDWKEGSVPSWADKARGRGVYVTVFIGGSRDARPHKARKPKKGSVEVRGGGEVGEGVGT
jgi:hypothetical protein